MIVRRYADPADFPDASGIPAITPEIVEHIGWDGLDAFGEPVVGAVKAPLTLNYYYRPFRYASRDGVRDLVGPDRERRVGGRPFDGRQGCSDVSAFDADGVGDICAFKLSTRETRASARRGATTSGSEGGTSMRITSTTRRPARSASATARSAVPARSMSAG